MTTYDIQLLGIGITLGAYLMLAVQLGFQALDDRRDRRAARAAMAQLEAARAQVTGSTVVADLPQAGEARR